MLIWNYSSVLCRVYAHFCSEIVRVFFEAALGFLGRTRTTPEQSQQQYRRKMGAIQNKNRTTAFANC